MTGTNSELIINSENLVQKCDLTDVEGALSRSVVVPLGTEAMVYENGKFLGVVENGTYTIETLGQKLLPWTKKNTTIYLVRTREFSEEFSIEEILTSDPLYIGVTLRFRAVVNDANLLLMNLVGPETTYSILQIREEISRYLRNAAQLVFGGYSIQDFQYDAVPDHPNDPPKSRQAEATLLQNMRDSFNIFGITFSEIKCIDIRHAQYDENRKKLGDIWLMRDGIATQEKLNQLEIDKRIQEIAHTEAINDTKVLASQVRTDYFEGKLAVMRRRRELRSKWREVVQSDQFDKIRDETELAKMLAEQVKAGLILDDEREQLIETFRNNREDRAIARSHMLEISEVRYHVDLYHEKQILRQLERDNEMADLLHKQRLQLIQIAIEKAQSIADDEDLRRRMGTVDIIRQSNATRRRERQEAADRRRKQDQEHELAMAKVTQETNVQVATALLDERERSLDRMEHVAIETARSYGHSPTVCKFFRCAKCNAKCTENDETCPECGTKLS